MLELDVKLEEMFDENKDEFVDSMTISLQLEHSLVSLSKWESFFKKPFLSRSEKTEEEVRWYIMAMNLTPDVPPEIFHRLASEHLNSINEYINDAQTATWFNEDKSARRSTDVITAELIYYWMIAFTIPSEYQYWHLNRLLTLIRVCNLKNSKQKKMSRSEWAAKQHSLNEQRLRELGTTG